MNTTTYTVVFTLKHQSFPLNCLKVGPLPLEQRCVLNQASVKGGSYPSRLPLHNCQTQSVRTSRCSFRLHRTPTSLRSLKPVTPPLWICKLSKRWVVGDFETNLRSGKPVCIHPPILWRAHRFGAFHERKPGQSSFAGDPILLSSFWNWSKDGWCDR